MESSWWQKLEQELEEQFDRFLSDHPNQKELLDQEHWNEQLRLKQERLNNIDEQAQRLREKLIELAKEISSWSKRIRKAEDAGAEDLALQAKAHVTALKTDGQIKWQTLIELRDEYLRLEKTC